VLESKHPRSAFSSGAFEAGGRRYRTTLLQVGAEEVGRMRPAHFDTVVMQNVLEHVADGYAVLESLYNATKPGGTVVLWEPSYSAGWGGWGEDEQELIPDVSLAFDRYAHPIRADPSVLRHFATFFEPLLWKEAPARRGDLSAVLVGRKKRLP
jgi:SAM-dependent methyltransferase